MKKISILKTFVGVLFGVLLFASCSEKSFDNQELVPMAKKASALSVSSVSASGNDGNVPANTLDGSLSTRWSSNGSGQYITYDLGSSATVSSIKIAWYKGNERAYNFKIRVGNSTSSMSTVYTGTSSGSSTALQAYSFTSVSARYVRVTVLGNTVNNWASITEAQVYGTGDTTGGGGGSSSTYPTDVIPSLVDWKLTLPVDASGNDNSNISDGTKRITTPLEIKDNNLIDYKYAPYFEVRDGEVVFRGHCAGVTTSGSWYPRCELRQRVGGGDNYWSVNKNQYLETNVRVTHLPDNKPELSMVQIHGPENEPLRVQFHATDGLYIVWNESNKDYFKSDVPYTLGQQLNIKVTVSGGDITCVVKNVDTGKSHSKTWTSNDSTGYFKVGCYTQSTIYLNQYKGGSYVNEPLTAYGEVTVSSINLVETY